MQINYSVLEEDYYVLISYCRFKLAKLGVIASFVIFPPLSWCLTFLITVSYNLSITIAIVTLILIYYVQFPNYKKRVSKLYYHNKKEMTNLIVSINEQGFEAKHDLFSTSINWTEIDYIDDLDEHIIIAGKISSTIIPKRYFTTESEVTKFYALIENYFMVQNNIKIS